ncbi:MAG: glycosyltransferase family 2 protein [Desulfobacterales bacterium]|nr:glycosyltransferase family 2 protein [Desulfobacterales bacterium]
MVPTMPKKRQIVEHNGMDVILPAYNEAEGLETVIHDLRSVKDKIGCDLSLIIVDDGSTDGTGEIGRRLSENHGAIRYVRHERNRGYGSAVISGIEAAVGRHAAIFDADGQFRAEDLSRLYRERNGFDVVVGYRQKRADPWQRRLLGNLWTLVGNLFFGLTLRDLNCGLKIFRSDTLKRLDLKCTGAGITLDIMEQIASMDIPIRQLPCSHYPRIHGRQTGADPQVIQRALSELAFLYQRRRQRLASMQTRKQDDEKRHEHRQDRSKSTEKAEFIP